VILTVGSILVGGFLVSVPEPASALSKTWATDADFAGGTFSAVEVVQSGAAAAIQLKVNPMYNWIWLNPPTAPSPRRGASMTYDEGAGVVLMFGGMDASYSVMNDLWKFSVPDNEWTNLTPAKSPPARWKAGFSYDPVQKATIMTGGIDKIGTKMDTWRFYSTNNTWEEPPRTSPSPRNLISTPLVYHPGARKHILAATNDFRLAFETWAYDAATNRWTDLAPLGSGPELREGHTLTYDRRADKVLLYGGGLGLQVHGDIWGYNYTSNTWTALPGGGPNGAPNPRTDHAMIFGPYGAVSILYGGIDDSGTYPPETWYYISAVGMWIQPLVTIYPFGRKDITFAWDSTRDRTIMFGGITLHGVVTNQTWMWGPGYYARGTYESTVFDAGCNAPTWQTLWWNATVPRYATARFKLATSSSPDGPFTFVGPDGYPGTYYNKTPGQAIWSGHNRPPIQRYVRWMTALTTGTGKTTPAVDDVTIVYSCADHLPYITSTYPADFASYVPLTADVVVSFSYPMNASTVTWSFSDPAVAFSPSWNPTYTVLTLKHAVPFTECTTRLKMEIMGRDKDDVALVPGPVPNPWTFNTGCFPPKILETMPASQDFNVPLGADIVVRFSEPMNTSTVTWSFSDPSITLTPGWDGAETNLTLTHAKALAPCTVYTAQVLSGKDKIGLPLVPGPVPNPWKFTTDCPNPYIARTSPISGAAEVPMISPIVVTFSKPMDTASVDMMVTPSVTPTRSWSAGDTVLTLDHATRFTEFTRYTVNVLAGREKGGLPLVPGPVPNPWSFVTERVWPKIVETAPTAGTASVPPDRNIVVTFSEAMDTNSVDAAISPFVALTRTWNSPTNTVLTLSHATPFAQCTEYTINVTGRDLQGFRLVPGPVPNPWSFTTMCPPRGPSHLRVEMSGSDVRLSWDPVDRATLYSVYSSQNRFQSWPWAIIGTTPTAPFLASGHGADLQTHYYIVCATNGTETGPNSSMGVKTTLHFGHATANTNIAWFSLPYTSPYGRASDIANALGPANIDLVGKWVPQEQSSVVYYYARDRWRGTDFPISPGDGLYLGTRRAFDWNLTGTDANLTLSFARNPPPRGNVNWLGVPFTGVYGRASDLADALGPSNITEVGIWIAATQTVVRWYWTGSIWTGTDFAIPPGAGTYIVVASSFTWAPPLITPSVP